MTPSPLRELAQTAIGLFITPSSWPLHQGKIEAFNAAANPTAILALLDEIDALKGKASAAGAEAADEPVAWDLGGVYDNSYRFITSKRYAAKQIADGRQADPLYSAATVSALRQRVEEAEAKLSYFGKAGPHPGLGDAVFRLSAAEKRAVLANARADAAEQRIADLTRERDEARVVLAQAKAANEEVNRRAYYAERLSEGNISRAAQYEAALMASRTSNTALEARVAELSEARGLPPRLGFQNRLPSHVARRRPRPHPNDNRRED